MDAVNNSANGSVGLGDIEGSPLPTDMAITKYTYLCIPVSAGRVVPK